MSDSSGGPFLPKTLVVPKDELTVRADAEGRLRLVVGAASGFEGVDKVGGEDVDVELTRR